MSSRFCVLNLGCRVNRVEADGICAALESAGALRTALDEADVVVVNTCTVTSQACHKARKAVRHALERSAAPCVVVTGCAVAIDPAMFESLSSRVTAQPDKAKALAFAARTLGLAHCDPSGFARTGRGFADRVGIKVQDGCDNACTFCIVHIARGKARSRDTGDVLREVRAAQDAGAREVILTGINLGAYECDGVGLYGLLENILRETKLLRVRLSSIEPPEVTDSLIELICASQGRVCRHLHLPLQSASPDVLRRMGRRYAPKDFAQLVGRIRKVEPTMSLSTDVIVGFPGETDADFELTCEMAKAARFSKMHIFRFSKRLGTPAADMPDQVPPDVSADRAERLSRLARDLREGFASSLSGCGETLLQERGGILMSERYLPASLIDSPSPSPGQIVSAQVVSSDGETLLCREIEWSD